MPEAWNCGPTASSSAAEYGFVNRLSTLVIVGMLAAAARMSYGAEADRSADTAPTEQAIADGEFTILTLAPRVGSTQAFVWSVAGYDSSRRGGVFDSAAEVQIWGPLALRGGATYSNDTARMRPQGGARLQLLRQSSHGLDAALGVFYKAEGFTEAEGEIETVASVGRAFGNLAVLANLAYGQDPEGNERDGEVRASIMRQGPHATIGFDSRVRFAIGTQHGKAAAIEPTFDVLAGPLVILPLGPVAVFAEPGFSAFKLGATAHLGMAVLAGMGAAF